MGEPLVEMCDGCHYSFLVANMVPEKLPSPSPEIPGELKLWCKACWLKQGRASGEKAGEANPPGTAQTQGRQG
jgi:hypothetical protein